MVNVKIATRREGVRRDARGNNPGSTPAHAGCCSSTPTFPEEVVSIPKVTLIEIQVESQIFFGGYRKRHVFIPKTFIVYPMCT